MRPANGQPPPAGLRDPGPRRETELKRHANPRARYFRAPNKRRNGLTRLGAPRRQRGLDLRLQDRQAGHDDARERAGAQEGRRRAARRAASSAGGTCSADEAGVVHIAANERRNSLVLAGRASENERRARFVIASRPILAPLSRRASAVPKMRNPPHRSVRSFGSIRSLHQPRFLF